MKTYKIEVTGHTPSDIEFAIREALRWIESGNVCGQNSNDTGSYCFESAGEYEEDYVAIAEDRDILFRCTEDGWFWHEADADPEDDAVGPFGSKLEAAKDFVEDSDYLDDGHREHTEVSSRSISDDDLCATCANLRYSPGDLSTCRLDFPALFDGNGYAVTCPRYERCGQDENLDDGGAE